MLYRPDSMNTAAPPRPPASGAEMKKPIFTLRFTRSLNDDRSDHARMDRAREVISTRLVEFEREALVRIHAARLEHSRVADHGVRLIVHVRPGHGRACFD